MVRMFDGAKLRPVLVAFDPRGSFVAVVFASGLLKLLDAGTLQDVPGEASFRNAAGAITHLAVSSDAQYLATADAGMCVCLYRNVPTSVQPGAAHGADGGGGGSPTALSWVYLGKYQSHTQPIVGLAFGTSGAPESAGDPTLATVGADRRLVEYDLASSSVAGGVQLRGRVRVEQTSVPNACLWLPAGASDGLLAAAAAARGDGRWRQWQRV